MTEVEKPDFLEESGLAYVSDEEQGYTRVRHGRGFSYLDCDRRIIRNAEERARIKALVIPPAWTEVWICPDQNGHILATGRDNAGRKQYIYHPDWETIRSQLKFDRMAAFGACLPGIRRQIQEDMRDSKLTREKVLALVVSLLQKTLIRIGNTYYTQHNESYGLTTLQDEHVKVQGKQLTFEFRGKSGIDHIISVEDKRLAAVVKACRDVPGHHLFQYYDDAGDEQAIGSEDVNTYLRGITGGEFSSKDFRTWGGSIFMIEVLVATPRAETEKAAQKQVVEAVKQVAERLGNKPAVARAYYIHPVVIEAFLEDKLHEVYAAQAQISDVEALDPYEATLMALMAASSK